MAIQCALTRKEGTMLNLDMHFLRRKTLETIASQTLPGAVLSIVPSIATVSNYAIVVQAVVAIGRVETSRLPSGCPNRLL